MGTGHNLGVGLSIVKVKKNCDMEMNIIQTY